MAAPPGRSPEDTAPTSHSQGDKVKAGNPYLGTRVSLLGAHGHPRHGLLGSSAGLCSALT